MSQLIGLLSPIGIGRAWSVADYDDFVDRLHHKYTVMILILMSVIVSTKQHVGDPIQCWVPGHFTRNHETYANYACWVSNTYYLPMDERIPLEGARRHWINYYQWLPMILLAQAALFHCPVLIWRGFSGKIGVQLHSLVEAGRNLHDCEQKEKKLRLMVGQVDRYLSHYGPAKRRCCCCQNMSKSHYNLLCGKSQGNYLAVLYLICKLFYFANCLTQLFMMDSFLGTDFHFYGFHALKSMFTREEWPGSMRFPTFTLCDYQVRQMGHNIHRTTLQCVLPINFFNDKLYLGLWFWFFMITIATGVNCIKWLCCMLIPTDGLRYIRRHLSIIKMADKKGVVRFIREYLRSDGILITRLVQLNSSDIAASELIIALYNHYLRNPTTPTKNWEETEFIDNADLV